jgi:hypothetical protein
MTRGQTRNRARHQSNKIKEGSPGLSAERRRGLVAPSVCAGQSEIVSVRQLVVIRYGNEPSLGVGCSQ